MGPSSNRKLLSFQALLFTLLCFCSEFCISIDTIKFTQSIRGSESLISNGNTFKLGFFSPPNTTNRYVGIWYNIPLATVVWVANREKPLNDSSGTVTISEDGNLVVLNGNNEIIWSSNVSNPMANSTAQILDTGNLVLRDNSSGTFIWESFQHPSDSFLPGMRMSTNVNTSEMLLLTSWRSPLDPSVGSFSVGLVPLDVPQVFIWRGSIPYWRTGPWNRQIFIGIPAMYSAYRDGFDIVGDTEGTFYLTYTISNESLFTFFILDSEGNLAQKNWYDGAEDWEVTLAGPLNECEVYGKCGPFGSCNFQDLPVCNCLRGFEPMNREEWSKGNWTSGCIRKTQLECEKNITVNEKGKEDVFLKLENMKVPDMEELSQASEDYCRSQCFNSCSCIAYSHNTGIGCLQWSGSLIDVQEFPTTGVDLYIRVAYSELDKEKNLKLVIAITITIGSVTIAVCTYFSWRWITKKRGRKRKNEQVLFQRGETYPEYSPEIIFREKMEKTNLDELPMYSFENLVNATDNFNSANKLGQGGFGPVYKGKLEEGQEVAVKRLSRSSGQGLEEFMNEVLVIAKLQHRNLVKLLGCCLEREEKMLIYEYMANGSLDVFLFDSSKQEHLDWSKRVNIIEGIGRGLLYLHRDSRLKIIHRDLKASNILLDEQLNPKISDFGLARIFGGDQDQANTNRVVGTFGYMAPEYVREGKFSEKSDVYSFGVLILEIISGRKNTGFYHDEHSLSLLTFAWKLWNEDNIITLIDPKVLDTRFKMEILRYIQVGLLCVQESVKDRPTVSILFSMVSGKIADLPSPKSPAFTGVSSSMTMFPEQSPQKISINNVTVTSVEGR